MADQSVGAEIVHEKVYVWIVIVFQMNVDITNDEQWVGERDDVIQLYLQYCSFY